MKIAHVGNTAGVAMILSCEQRKIGHDPTVFVFDNVTHRLFGGKKVNYKFPLSKWNFFRILKEYEVWHYHYPHGKLMAELEHRKQDNILIKHYHGDDLRGHHDPDYCFVSTPDLLKWAPNGKWLPNPINITEIESLYVNRRESGVEEKNSLLKVGYYPAFKYYPGEDFVSKSIFDLSKNHRLIPVEIFNLHHNEALKRVSECDIIVGKILPDIGWHGQLESEAMLLRKPVICYISDDLFERYSPPVFRTSKDTFYNDLLYLLQDSDTRRRLSSEGPAYVKKYHDVHNITRIVEKAYSGFT